MSTDETRVVSARLEMTAPSARVFELIADPAAQPRWDGNDNLVRSEPGQRVRRAGQVFTTHLTNGMVRENHVVDFVEGVRIAWRPAEPGLAPPGHQWSFELETLEPGRTRVTHTYDWSELTDEGRMPRARATTSERLLASLERLRDLAEDDRRG